MANELTEKLSLAYLLGKDYNHIQADIILSPAYEIAAVTGMGAGKTYALCVAALRHAAKWPGANILVSRLTYRELIDSTKRQFFEMVESKKLRELFIKPVRWDYREGTNHCRLVNGSEIHFTNLEPGKLDKIKNLEYSLIAVDQAEEIDYSTYQILLLRCRLNAVPPSERHVISIANDEGDNWIRRRFLTFEPPHGRPTAQATRHLLRGSSLDNPHLDEGARAQLLSLPPEVQSRYVFATMAAGSTRLLPDFQIIEAFEPPAHWPRFLGIDPARSTGVTCAIWIAVNPDKDPFRGVKPNAPYIYREYWSEGREAEVHAKAIEELTGPYRCSGRIMDRTAWSATLLSKKKGIISVAGLYVGSGLGVAPSSGDEWARVGLFLEAQRRGLVVANTCTNLLRQGPEYRVRGQAIFDHTGVAKNLKIVGKQHFHSVDAAGYAFGTIPTKVVAVDIRKTTEVYEIPDHLDRASQMHWIEDRKQFAKLKGGQPVITEGFDEAEFHSDDIPPGYRRYDEIEGDERY